MSAPVMAEAAAGQIVNYLQASFNSATRLYDLTIEGLQVACPPGAAITGWAPGQTLMVEAWCGTEALHTTAEWTILALSLDAHLDLSALLGKPCTLHTALSDGTRSTRSGLIRQAALVGSEGGLARYRLSVVDWTWMLGQSLASRVWQDTAVLDIVASVFARYAPQAAWRVTADVGPFLQESAPAGADSQPGEAPKRSYCVQYRETDLAFVQRLLADEGLSWRLEEHADSPAWHRLVIFADSRQPDALDEDASSAHTLGGRGIRFHQGHAQEAQDGFQALVRQRSLPCGVVTLLSTDYKARQSIAASAATTLPLGGPHAPRLERYWPGAPYASANRNAAQRQAELRSQALEARAQRWWARGTVRTLRAGTRFTLSQAPLAELNAPGHAGLAVLAVTAVGINNLPKAAHDTLAALWGGAPELLHSALSRPSTLNASSSRAKSANSAMNTGASSYQNSSALDAHAGEAAGVLGQIERSALIAQAKQLGYANGCALIEAQVPWRPLPASLAQAGSGGAQTALVVGPNGLESDTSAGDVYLDALGRIRIRFMWQGLLADADGATSGAATCWVRVAQRSAGAGMGLQFLPRVGQEVLVQFLGGALDRPIVVAALYNGQGAGGLAPTPGGQAAVESASANPFAASGDQRPAGQANRMAAGTGGHAPAWFGSAHGRHGLSESPVAAGGQANRAAQWGIRTQEWGSGAGGGGSTGYNQLVFDDSDSAAGNQQRLQLKTSQFATELNLGHLIHSADNHRGSLRGRGFELRTDAWGAVRAGSGLLLTTYPVSHSATRREPAGDNAPALALLKQAHTLSQTFSQAASTHQTVALASQVGSTAAGQSASDDKAAPLAALYKLAATQVGSKDLAVAQSDAPHKSISPAPDKLPHSGDATLTLAGKGGLAFVAGQSLQLASGETVSLMAGQDSQTVTGGQLRVHSGQAIGLLAGAVDKGEQGEGLSLVATTDPVRYEAQSNAINIQAKDLINIQSANSHIDWAAAKLISLSTAGGANITIDGGNITVQCPGKLTVHASSKSFAGPVSKNFPLPELPRGEMPDVPPKFNIVLKDVPGPNGLPLTNTDWRIVRAAGEMDARMSEEEILSGTSDSQGKLKLSETHARQLKQAYNQTPNKIWLVYETQVREFIISRDSDNWTEQQRMDKTLDAMGYSDRSGIVSSETTDKFHSPLAQKEYQSRTAAKLFDQIKQ